MNNSYQQFLNECMLEFVKKILARIRVDKLQMNQLLYISYRTDNPAVVLSSRIKERYPKEITIVMQYQFEDLTIGDNGFSVTVSFDGIKETINVPFDSLISFIDPNSGYSLRFKPEIIKSNQLSDAKKRGEIKGFVDSRSKSNSADNIIVLDKFRKPRKPV
ncbi:ClpXP protease specificity-enhancing factor SspB [Candidatus Tisiphia endosymbiont of Hybos culiciformis]|uniref:ClpXP protease specificity-enhancing factor SspB n=1 Tax=Candidatus Tisiphia endosymbiont of Hybos culiciformis TaxID=3139331 RepID=UPI003CCB6A1F